MASLPLLMWLVRNAIVRGEATDRRLDFHLPGLKQVVVAFSTVSSWLLLGKVRTDLRAGFFIAEVIVASVFILYLSRVVRQSSPSWRKGGAAEGADDQLVKLPLVILIFVISYLGFLIITATLFDVVIFDERTLVPVHVVAIIFFTCLAARFWPSFQDRRAIRIGLALVALSLIGSYSLRAAKWLTRTRLDGQGYASRTWKDSQTIAHLKTLPPNVFIYSNGYDAIYYFTGRAGQFIPEKTVFVTGRANENYEVELETMKRTMRENNGVLVYFDTLPERWYQPPESELRTRLSLSEVAKYSDGSIMEVR